MQDPDAHAARRQQQSKQRELVREVSKARSERRKLFHTDGQRPPSSQPQQQQQQQP
jgi:hypothetical protein